jgi:membrane protease YdiL (CAAX protease family)
MTDQAAVPDSAPSRARIVPLVLVVLGAAQPAIGSASSWCVLAGVLAAVALALWLRSVDAPETKDAVVLVGLMYAIGAVPGIGLWPIGPLVSLLLTAGVSWRTGRLSRWREWLRIGHVDSTAWLAVATVGVVSVVGLELWHSTFHGQLPQAYRLLAASVPAPVAAAGGLGFLILNGAVEDSVFFGVLLTPVLRHYPRSWAIGLIAVGFGTAHVHGVPNGAPGIVLAAAWAVMLAYLRTRTEGMLATYLAHIVADGTIVILLLLPLLFAD